MAKEQNTNIYEFIDKELSELLALYALSDNKRVRVSKVIKMLLILESLIPQIVIDGDEMVKYFNKKSHKG